MLEGRPISAVQFDPPQQPLALGELQDLVRIRAGNPLRLGEIRSAIDRLFATGRYSDIVVEASEASDGIAVRFLTRGRWFVGRVTLTGVDAPPSASQLVNATGLTSGNPFYPEEDLKQAEDGLRRVLAANGYLRPFINSHLFFEATTQQANVHFEIEPGKRSRFSEPVIVGQPKRTVSEIVKLTGWKGWFGWRPITEARVQRGLERIARAYQERNYLLARVQFGGLDPSSERPIIEIEAGPQVHIETSGAKVSRSRLRSSLPVFEEHTVSRDLLAEGARNLTEYLQTQGFFEAKVDFEMKPQGEQRLDILYHIQRGPRYRLTDLVIRGNKYFDLATLRERMLIAPRSLHMRQGRFSALLLKRDLEAIEQLYRSNGFREAKVTSRVETDYQGRQGDVAVFIDVDEGPQTIIADNQIEGASPEHLSALKSILQSGPGQPFSEANVAADRDNILAYYFNRGYPSTSFDWSYQQTDEPGRVNLRFVINEGPRLFVREVLPAGLVTTRPPVVSKRITLRPGEPISQAELLETQRRLYELGIFAKVDTVLQNPEGEERNKFVLLQVEESRKYSLAFGFGAELARIGGSRTSLEAPAGQPGFSPRVSFDISRLNFWGRAHTISLRSRVSNLQQRALISYSAPQAFGSRKLDLTFTTMFDASRNVRTFSARRWEGSTQLAYRWTRSKTFFFRFAYRRVSVDQGTLKIRPELIPFLSQPVRVGALSASYVDDRRDDPTDSRRGTYNSVDLSSASRIFGSETDYLRLLARNSTYHPLGRGLVLARSLSLGAMQSLRSRPELPPSPQDIPLPERFFAGGASSLRAFPENQAGPRDLVTGFPLGGKALLAFGTELRFPLYGSNIRGVLFHDAGNVYSDLENISFRLRQRNKQDFDYMVHAIGVGIRYRTPVGPIRVDLAFGPNTPRFAGCRPGQQLPIVGACEQSDQRINRFQFHFSLGQSF